MTYAIKAPARYVQGAGELDNLGRSAKKLGNKFLVICSDNSRVRFGQRVEAAIGESQGVARKPAPDTVFRALAELGQAPEGAVYVGDSDVDILTAKNAGLPCIAVSWGFRSRAFLEANGARIIADTMQELEQLLLGRKS